MAHPFPIRYLPNSPRKRTGGREILRVGHAAVGTGAELPTRGTISVTTPRPRRYNRRHASRMYGCLVAARARVPPRTGIDLSMPHAPVRGWNQVIFYLQPLPSEPSFFKAIGDLVDALGG